MKSYKIKYLTAIIFTFVSTASIACIAFEGVYSSFFENRLSYIIGAVFWIGIVFEQIFFWMANADRKKFERKQRRLRVHMNADSPVGAIAFFQCGEAVVSDAALFAFAIAVTLLSVLKYREPRIIILCVALLFLSFNLHCFLNGRNFRFIKSYNKYMKEQEKNG